MRLRAACRRSNSALLHPHQSEGCDVKPGLSGRGFELTDQLDVRFLVDGETVPVILPFTAASQLLGHDSLGNAQACSSALISFWHHHPIEPESSFELIRAWTEHDPSAPGTAAGTSASIDGQEARSRCILGFAEERFTGLDGRLLPASAFSLPASSIPGGRVPPGRFRARSRFAQRAVPCPATDPSHAG